MGLGRKTRCLLVSEFQSESLSLQRQASERASERVEARERELTLFSSAGLARSKCACAWRFSHLARTRSKHTFGRLLELCASFASPRAQRANRRARAAKRVALHRPLLSLSRSLRLNPEDQSSHPSRSPVSLLLGFPLGTGSSCGRITQVRRELERAQKKCRTPLQAPGKSCNSLGRNSQFRGDGRLREPNHIFPFPRMDLKLASSFEWALNCQLLSSHNAGRSQPSGDHQPAVTVVIRQ